jgi:polyisoprenoid-binding protein YceI
MNASTVRRAALAGGAILVLTASSLGYSYLKPTAEQSAPIESVYMSSMLEDDDAATVYTIDTENSKASFTVDEVLRGAPFTVVGTTDQVAGQIAFDPSNPSAAQLGTITINARTLAIDDSSRDRALGNQILSTSTYEYITFTPMSLSGLPSSVTVGEPFSFEATGDLTIKDVIRTATFDVTVVPTTDGQLQGTATTTIQYADWGVSIPSVPFVASVDKEVALQLDFAASSTA